MGMPADRCECVNVCVRLCLPRPSTVDNTPASQQTCWLSGTTSLQHRRVLAKLYVDFYWSELLNRLGLLLTFTFLPFPFFSREIPFRYLTFSWDHTGLCGRFFEGNSVKALCRANQYGILIHSFIRLIFCQIPDNALMAVLDARTLGFFWRASTIPFSRCQLSAFVFLWGFHRRQLKLRTGFLCGDYKVCELSDSQYFKRVFRKNCINHFFKLKQAEDHCCRCHFIGRPQKKMMVWFKIMQYTTVIPWDTSQPSS